MVHQCRGCMLKELYAAGESENMPKGSTIRLVPKATAERIRLEAALNPPGRPRLRRG